MMLKCPFRRLIPSLAMACLSMVVGCAPRPSVVERWNTDREGNTFGYHQWVADKVEPDLVLIGIHGFSGSATDYENLGEYLFRHQPRTGLYAYEIRGQGRDPIPERRGDIGRPQDWYSDLYAFTRLVREKHPQAKLVWYGESMGALIAAHAWNQAPDGQAPCDGLILSSPIVGFRDDVPACLPGLIQVAAKAVPLARISLETLTGGEPVPITQGSTYMEQAQKNPYHIEKYTLRLINTLSNLIADMNDCAVEIGSPILLLHGGQDYFNTDVEVRGFMARLPESTPATYRNYPKAYHLLMYDTQKERVFRDVTRWLGRLRAGEFQN